MRGPTLPFAPMKTYYSILVDFREMKKRKRNISLSFSFSLSVLSSFSPFLLLLFSFLSFFFLFILFIFFKFVMCPSFVQVRFCTETIYLLSIHFILNELSSSHFPTSEIFVKISSLKSLTTYNPENRKNILIVSEFYETFLGHQISRDEFNGAVHFFI